MKHKKHILVTGGAGFIGSNLVDRLITLGNTVTIFDNLTTGTPEYINNKATFIKGDTFDERAVKKLFQRKFDAVCHIAGCASSIRSFTNAYEDIQSNFIGTTNIIMQCIKQKVPRLLYASSMTVYGYARKLPVTENTTCKPISYYGISKYASERFVHATSERIDLNAPFNVTSFRMFNVYGPRQSLLNPYQGVMAIFIGNVIRREPIVIFGDGKQSRDFVYIDDVVDVWIRSIDNKKTFGKAFNLGYGVGISINKLVSGIIKTLGYDPETYPVTYQKERPGDQRHMRSNISALEKALKWKPKMNLEKGLIKTLAWAQKEQK